MPERRTGKPALGVPASSTASTGGWSQRSSPKPTAAAMPKMEVVIKTRRHSSRRGRLLSVASSPLHSCRNPGRSASDPTCGRRKQCIELHRKKRREREQEAEGPECSPSASPRSALPLPKMPSNARILLIPGGCVWAPRCMTFATVRRRRRDAALSKRCRDRIRVLRSRNPGGWPPTALERHGLGRWRTQAPR